MQLMSSARCKEQGTVLQHLVGELDWRACPSESALVMPMPSERKALELRFHIFDFQLTRTTTMSRR